MSDPAYSVTNRPGAAEPVPAVVSLHVYGVSGFGVARAVANMGLHRGRTRRIPGATFTKFLGTGAARTFTSRDADPGHWAVLTCWSGEDGPGRFEESQVHESWSRIADESARFLMRPLVSRGSWSGREPFGDPVPRRWDGPVAAVTRARIKTSQWRAFWSAVAPVSTDLREVEGLRFALGIGEAPVGLQGTVSIWDSHSQLTEFAHRRAPHVEVMRRTGERQWYAEELFARFALIDVSGTYEGREI